MRISDWSSDVCSSDLFGKAGEANPRRQVDHAIFNAAIITHKHGQCLTLRQRHKTELPQHGLPLWHQYDSSTGREPGQHSRRRGPSFFDRPPFGQLRFEPTSFLDRKSVGWGKSVSDHVEL